MRGCLCHGSHRRRHCPCLQGGQELPKGSPPSPPFPCWIMVFDLTHLSLSLSLPSLCLPLSLSRSVFSPVPSFSHRHVFGIGFTLICVFFQGDRFMGALSAVKTRAPVTAGSFAVWGGVFSSFDCTLAYLRQKEDPWNSIASGFLTGGVLTIRCTWPLIFHSLPLAPWPSVSSSP